MQTERTRDEVEAVIQEADPQVYEGKPSRWPGMSYEQGVSDALRWITGDASEAPFEEA